MFLLEIVSELIELATSETKNPSFFQGFELDRHQKAIQQLCGHGFIEAVKGKAHTYECNGIRFEIQNDTMRKL